MSGEFRHVLVPVDFSSSSDEALEVAVGVAIRNGAAITLVHACAVPVYGYPGMAGKGLDILSAVEKAAKEQLDEVLARLRTRVPTAQAMLRVGEPDQEILRAIDETRADLVVMGTHGRRGFRHAFLGSVAERTVRQSPVPVLTVRGKDEARTAAA
jgi:nucleotide-binding universal stress UspA family protein